MQGLAARLYRARPASTSPTTCTTSSTRRTSTASTSAGFCRRYARVYREPAGRVRPRGRHGRGRRSCFFAKVLVFEEIVDRYNWCRPGTAAAPPGPVHQRQPPPRRGPAPGLRPSTSSRRCGTRYAPAGTPASRPTIRALPRAVLRRPPGASTTTPTSTPTPASTSPGTWPRRRGRRPPSGRTARRVSARCLAFLIEAGILDGGTGRCASERTSARSAAQWVDSQGPRGLAARGSTDTTPLFEQRHADVAARARADPAARAPARRARRRRAARPGDFRDIDTIVDRFFARGAGHERRRRDP